MPTRGVRRALRCGAALRSATGRAGGGGPRTQRSGAAPATARRPGHRSTAAQHVAHTFVVTRCEPAPALSRASVAHAVVPGAPYARMAAAGGSPAHVVAALFILRDTPPARARTVGGRAAARPARPALPAPLPAARARALDSVPCRFASSVPHGSVARKGRASHAACVRGGSPVRGLVSASSVLTMAEAPGNAFLESYPRH